MGTWEVEVSYGSMFVQERNDVRPCFPPIVLIVDHDSGFILGTVTTQQTQEMPQAIVEELEKIVSTHHARPKRLLVKQRELYELFQELEEKTSVTCEMVEWLPGCQEVKNSLDVLSY